MKPWRHALPGAAGGILAMALVAAAASAPVRAQGQAQGQDQGHSPHGPPPAAPSKGERQKAPKDAQLYIGWPNNGEVVSGRFKVWFGLRNFGVAPAGVRKDNTGHHHLVIDADLPPPDEPIPNTKNYLHFGKGQTETYLELPPGRHTLQLLLGDADHVPHDPPVVSRKITITVRPSSEPLKVSER